MKKIISLILSVLMLSCLIVVPSFAEEVEAKIWLPVLETLGNHEAWEVEVYSTINPSRAYKRFIIDENPETYWHSYYENSGTTITYRDAPPHDIDITLPEETPIYGFSYTTRPGGGSGSCTKYETYAKVDGEWVLLNTGEMSSTAGTRTVTFAANVPVKEFRFRFVESSGGYGTCAELNLLAPYDGAPTVSAKEYFEYSDSHGIVEIPGSKIAASCEVPSWGSNTPDRVLDGTDKNFWQTDATKDPVVLELDLGGTYAVTDFDITPRQSSDFHGTWTEFSVWSSLDGENFDLVADGLSLEKSLDTKRITLSKSVKARYIQFEISGHLADRASCAEIKVYQDKGLAKELEKENQIKYELKIGSKDIVITKGTAAPKTVTLDVAPYIDGGYTLIPLRGLLEEMGASIAWDGDIQMVTVDTSAMKIELQIWNKLVFVTGGRYGRVRYTLNEPPRIVEGRTFIPLRFVSEHLGYNVAWDGATQTITITNY